MTELAEHLPGLTAARVNAAVRRHLDTQGTPDDILAEDKVIAAYPLNDVSVKVVPVGEMFET